MQREKIEKAAAYIQKRIGYTPKVGLILGSGHGSMAERIENPVVIPYGEIPYFTCSTAPGHKGQLVCGRLSGTNVICMQGRLHYYEGHAMRNIVFPVRVMKSLNVETLIMTNAAGGINLGYQVGDIMVIKDHINLLGYNPLIGPNEDSFGPRFCDMTYTYTPQLREIARDAAEKQGIALQEGVYIACTGPSFETPAEIRAFRIMGADAVGMSTVPEAITASHCGMKLLAFSLITNMAAGVLDQKLTEEEVEETGRKTGHILEQLILECIRNIGQ